MCTESAKKLRLPLVHAMTAYCMRVPYVHAVCAHPSGVHMPDAYAYLPDTYAIGTCYICMPHPYVMYLAHMHVHMQSWYTYAHPVCICHGSVTYIMYLFARCLCVRVCVRCGWFHVLECAETHLCHNFLKCSLSVSCLSCYLISGLRWIALHAS